jgi:hypothetical protein
VVLAEPGTGIASNPSAGGDSESELQVGAFKAATAKAAARHFKPALKNKGKERVRFQ